MGRVSKSFRSRGFRVRAAAAVGATTIVMLAGASAASAHVVVTSPDAAPGEEIGELVFRVPNESPTAGTVRIQVDLPTDPPFVQVSAESKPGWLISTETKKLAQPVQVEGFSVNKVISSVTWTATGDNQIRPGQFDEFALSVGPFQHDVTTLSFPTVQTYSDGTTVNWNQIQKPGAEEPEHPAPTLDLTAVSGDSATSAPTTTAAAQDSSDTVARVLGVAGILIGLVTLGVVLTQRRGGARPTASDAETVERSNAGAPGSK